MHIQSGGGGSSVGYFCWRPSEKTAYWRSHNDDISAAIINIDGARLYFADNTGSPSLAACSLRPGWPNVPKLTTLTIGRW